MAGKQKGVLFLEERGSFIHPCKKCQGSVQRAQASRWDLDAKNEDFYQCKACEVFGRHTRLSVTDFARQVESEYQIPYRLHRANLFVKK